MFMGRNEKCPMQVISSIQIYVNILATKQLHPFGAPSANTPQKPDHLGIGCC